MGGSKGVSGTEHDNLTRIFWVNDAFRLLMSTFDCLEPHDRTANEMPRKVTSIWI